MALRWSTSAASRRRRCAAANDSGARTSRRAARARLAHDVPALRHEAGERHDAGVDLFEQRCAREG
jgi:hypothetical protein